MEIRQHEYLHGLIHTHIHIHTARILVDINNKNLKRSRSNNTSSKHTLHSDLGF